MYESVLQFILLYIVVHGTISMIKYTPLSLRTPNPIQHLTSPHHFRCRAFLNYHLDLLFNLQSSYYDYEIADSTFALLYLLVGGHNYLHKSDLMTTVLQY